MKSKHVSHLCSCMASAKWLLIFAMMTATISASAQTWSERVLQVFYSPTGPQAARGLLVLDKSGNLYGTSSAGGTSGKGTVFKLKRSLKASWPETVLYNFTGGNDGGVPYAGMVLDSLGNFYGTTTVGGTAGHGVVFELSPPSIGSTTWTETVLYNFTGGNDGGAPYAGVVFDSAGNLYGTTVSGGISQAGVVFELSTPNAESTAWTESVLYSFTRKNDGGWPYAGLTFDASGNLYGTTIGAGTGGDGVVFELSPPSAKSTEWTETVLHSFTSGPDGAIPYGGLVFDKAGNLYGTNVAGGTPGLGDLMGIVYKLAPNQDGTWTLTPLANFGCYAGIPYAGLTIDASGNLYGTTQLAHNERAGLIYELSPTPTGGWSFSVPWQLVGWGINPYAGVILDTSGNLYGVTSTGSNNYGLVFELIP